MIKGENIYIYIFICVYLDSLCQVHTKKKGTGIIEADKKPFPEMQMISLDYTFF